MTKILRFTVVATLAVVAAAASAADLEFHGYSRVGWGFSTSGGNQVAFGLDSNGGMKLRLGNEADWVIEPSFEMKFTKLDDKSEWGVHMLPAVFRRFNDPGADKKNSDGGLPVSYKEYYFFGNNVPQLGGGSIFVGRKYFDRASLGSINDQFIEAQDGVGAGIDAIPIGPARLGFGITATAFTDGSDAQVGDRDASFGVHVTNIPTFNKNSSLQLWARVYTPMQKKDGVTKRKTGYSASAMHIASFGEAGTLTLAARYDKNAYTDQQNTGAGGWEQARGAVVYGVNVPAARTSIDFVAEYAKRKTVAQTSAALTADQMHDIDWFEIGARTDTQLVGPFRFLLEAGYDTTKDKKQDNKVHRLLKITPCLALSAGTETWSNPTFRVFYTYASWNKDAEADIGANYKSTGFSTVFAGKKSGSVIGVQAQAGW